MRIYIDGIACSGKTTFIEEAKKNWSQIEWIAELPENLPVINSEICRRNDVTKSVNAKMLSSKDKTVLVDRSYVSTLAYNYILFRLNEENEYIKTLEWYKNFSQLGKLSKPELFVYYAIDSKSALERAVKSGKFSNKYAWFKKPDYAIIFFKYFYKFLEPDVPVLVLNGHNEPSYNVEVLRKKIKSINKEKHE
jgi:thymidylate kinase